LSQYFIAEAIRARFAVNPAAILFIIFCSTGIYFIRMSSGLQVSRPVLEEFFFFFPGISEGKKKKNFYLFSSLMWENSLRV
jgi:hypothetical protein